MPDMNRDELAKQLRAHAASAQAIFIALITYGQTHDRVPSKAARFGHHFVKPVDTHRLTKILSQVN
jgi:CheY-like chemotaxis protein